MTCLICDRPQTKTEDWQDSLKYLIEEKLLCETHEKEGSSLIREVQKVILEPSKSYMPPLLKQSVKDFTEPRERIYDDSIRQPGEE